jgi:hypothetical protein
MKNLYRSLGVNLRFSTTYHPKTQGQVENNNKWLETYLQMFCAYRQDDWVDFLHMAEFAYNNHYHPSIGTSPFFTNYGYHPVYTNCMLLAQVLEMPKCLQAIHEVQAKCQLTLDLAQKAQKQYADRRWGPKQDINVGDHVWLEAINLSMDAPSKKLGAKQISPFKVTEKLSEMTFRVNVPVQWHIHNIFHSHLLSKTKTDMIPGQIPDALPPVMVHGEEQWVIE